ncbi:MAG TPA: TolC family protein [Pleomorphomonadaceae bacterium]|nr:TolC family protein [Pleomorphomonadaceae bacterium]
MTLGLLALAAMTFQDSTPRISLDEALTRAARVDVGYVQAVGQLNDAEWGRRLAFTVFILPSVTASSDYINYSTPQFNVGTGQQAGRSVTARLDARYELFTGGRKLAELSRSRAVLDGAQANEVLARYEAAFFTERDYYGVLSAADLLRVMQARLERAEAQLGVARARVTSGAAVQSDSLQLLLEVTRARVALLQAQANRKVSQLELGRRVGVAGAIDAEPLADLTLAPLGVSVEQALSFALDQGPLYRIVRASERIADATLRSARSRYLPTAVVSANIVKFDENFFPNALQRSTLTVGVSLPIWDNGQRELAVARARASRDVARAVREDLERGALADVTEAWEAYHTATASAELAEIGVEVAVENFRVQERRYQAGASTILDLLEAQNQLTDAEVAVVQARFAARLSLAGLEVLLGRRLQQ